MKATRSGALTQRTAIVQHGDYAEALELMSSGAPEPYFGMRSSVEMIERLVDDHPHLIISLNGRRRVVERAQGRLVGMPRLEWPRAVPRRYAAGLWARRILRLLDDFRPTRVLYRGDDFALSARVLGYCVSQGIDTLVAMAAFMPEAESRPERALHRRVVELLNQPAVALVGNHRWPATESLIEQGLQRDKAVAYDLSNGREPRRPQDHAPKQLQPGPLRLLFLGNVLVDKGIEDVIDAARLLAERGRPVELSVVGDGDALGLARSRAADLPDGVVRFLGRVGNDQAFQLLLESSLAIVPSRARFREGLPMSLTEALISRTPAVISNHPVFVKAFQEGEGVTFFRERDPAALAARVEELLESPERYAALSRSTADAFARVDCPVTLEDLVERWLRGRGAASQDGS